MYLPGQYFGLEGSHMAFFAKLDGLHSRKTAESWADDAEFGYRRRLPHNSGHYQYQNKPKPDLRVFIGVISVGYTRYANTHPT